ncbi:HET-domain-containing protein [Lentithecium fluviatile CBS 122367]|uniref:HET-domain-containing protein n=1 Tax=Lentithecium fluviatile CBS 122367 TaxID=1168545 RepID=A0A6G1IMA5_9PLEO|nr:HET-domain-containing protein [Lentithecium fluviatile CBS 122367]
MRLCEFCIDTIFKSKESWEKHRSYAELEESAEWSVPVEASDLQKTREAQKKDRCLFCSALHSDIDRHAPELKNHNGPIHRWTIRSLSRIRESLETVVVTFHPIPITPERADDTVKEAKLPTRTFYCFPEESLGPLPTPDELGTWTDPAKNGGAQIKHWISSCDETHAGCMKHRKAKSKSSHFVPTRLLDISGPPKAPIKVIETGKASVRSPYATLSHCWGRKPIHCLMPDNYKRYVEEEGVPWHLLTRNFQEAIEVARFLGIKYIWIDSLCIIQDGIDFKKEGEKMHAVYRNSYCNIAIVDSEDSTGGLFRKREPGDVAPVMYQPDLQDDSGMFGNKAWRVLASDMYETELLKTKLYVRGWVFQERMLAPRSLHFANRQIFWDCASISACESLPSGFPPPMDGPARGDRHWRGRLQESQEKTGPLAGGRDDPLMEFWKSAVRKYTSCALTNRVDKTLALWGIAKLVRDELGDEYGMGLWEHNLVDQLVWRVAECTKQERPPDPAGPGKPRKFPTWSWASMDEQILVPDRLSKSNAKHWTVKDHTGQDLKFDLVGVERRIEPGPIRTIDAVPPPQVRSKSDSTVGQKTRYQDLEQTLPLKKSRDAEPEFYNTSLPIAGHVGRARLEQDPIGNGWLLTPEGFSGDTIEAYPDTIPNQDNEADQTPFFVVLSAKQDVKPSLSDVMVANEPEDGQESGDDEGLREHVVTEEFDVSGMGILMKNVGGGHFCRTGAFVFSHIGKENGNRLLELEKMKFWLD